MTNVITAIEQITPVWLTDILHRAGVLPEGAVLEVACEGNRAFNSIVTHLTLTYTSTAPPTAPRQLLLKRNLTAPWAVRAGAREVAFYQMVARLPDRLPMIGPCYDAVYNAETGRSHVLLRDLSATRRR